MLFFQFFKLGNEKGGTAELLKLAFPMMISAACDVVMTFTDRYFLSKLEPEQMNAAFGGGISYQLLIFFFIGLTGYSTALVAQYFGSGRRSMVGVVAFQAIVIAFIAYPIILICKPIIIKYFEFMNLPAKQMGYQVSYFNIVVYGAIFVVLRHTLGCYFSGIGKTKIVMVANLVAMTVNLALDYILVFGKFGFPQMRIEGAALATVIGGICGFLVLMIAYFGPVNWRKYQLAKSFHFDRTVMHKLLYYGYPAGVELFFNFLAYTALVFVFQAHGDVVSTATSIVLNWDMVSFVPLLGIEIGVTSLVGRYMGARDPVTAHRAAISGIKTGMFYSFVILILFITIPDALVLLFSPFEETMVFIEAIPIATTMVRFAALYVLSEAVMVAIVGALRGAGDTHFTMLISVASHWIMLPVVFISLNVFHFSAEMAWLSLIVVFLLFSIVLILRFRSKKWQRIRIIEEVTSVD